MLDITYEGNNFEADMVTDICQGPANAEIDLAVQIIGGPVVVRALGDNFKDYVRAWRNATIDAGSPIEIYYAPQMIRVQQADPDHISDNDDSYRVSTTAPSNDSYLTGSSTNNYLSTYIFKTPLTFTIVESGVTKYITFRTVLDQE